MPALFVSHVHVKNQALFAEYLEKSKTLATTFGAELVTRGKRDHSPHGELPEHQLVVIARFQDMNMMRAWLTSDAYQQLVPLREQASDQYMTAYEEL